MMSEDRERRRDLDREREEGIEVGRKGGAASMAAGMPVAGEAAGVAFWTRDLVRWGPIWAGLLIALAVQIVLATTGLAVALSAYDPAEPNYAARVADTLSIWSVVSALIALFVGGYIAGRMAAVLGLRNGLVQGTVVWALTLLLGLLLSVFGIAGLLGVVNITPFLRGSVALSPAEQANIARTAASSSWWFVVGAILAWIAAAGGGILGAAAHTDAIEESR